jgi:BirA family biotin operon repressor/biotin-[acetyl-CoA-carboxylase] ligase
MPPGFDLLALGSVGSTNDEAKRLVIEDNAGEGTVIWARAQTAGRGRERRTWDSPAGNMYCSIILRPEIAAARAGQIAFLAGLALMDGVADRLGSARRLTLKWPNDLLADGKKVGGILLEGGGRRQELLDWLICGCGLNLVNYPSGTDYPATSIAETFGVSIEPGEMVGILCACFKTWLDEWRSGGFAPLRAAWLERARGLGGPVSVRLGAERLDGTLAGIDDDGALMIEGASGRRRITAGDLFFPAIAGEG